MQTVIYSTIAGLSTLLGTLIVLISGIPSNRVLSILLGFAGGVMLSVSTFELLPESLKLSSIVLTIPGFLLGGSVMWIIDKLINQIISIVATEQEQLLKTGYLVVLGIGLHNLPEGLAIGTGIEASPAVSLAIAISLGLHNIPEGMASAGPLQGANMSKLSIIGLVTLAGLMTPLGTIIGMISIGITPNLVGSSLSFAAGAMIYLAINELIPNAQEFSKTFANIGVFIGIVIGNIIVM
ncbi:ZIP family metal transporter [Natranaerobius trueperi]|uniref:Zinc/iron permease n=1 Tax=Natranaerobius trueperi TaxID=759412 RepID=A0A226C065_9FIRM|nr:ZIP family metal transporter [Natranaerobius trueperi]OWZ84688.1 zinc/iron permease [Natranaerobius trueperi]